MKRTLVSFVLAFAASGACTGVQAADPANGYLFPGANLHIQAWLPAAPPRDSLAQAVDLESVLALRAELDTARGAEAHQDDVYQPADVATRFDAVLGIHLDAKTAPRTLHLLQLVSNDAEWLMRPVKRSVADGGRQRPFVQVPSLHTCAIGYAKLGETGSYPSGHGSLGWIWGNVLAELAPDQADALIARGIAFGDSRVVCGFHFPSDIAAGRLVASALLEREHTDKHFLGDLDAARAEMNRLRAHERK